MISLSQDPPYMTLKSNSAFLAGNDRFEGYLADILRLLATSVGFDYEIRLSRDGKHGDLHADGTWDGMIGDVHRGVMTIAVAFSRLYYIIVIISISIIIIIIITIIFY